MNLVACVVPLFLLSAGASPEDLLHRDTLEVKARLLEVPGKPPPNDLYDYAYVMKYKVEGGALDGQTLLVAHFNPRQARAKVRDDMKKWVAGSLSRFNVGDLHQLLLSPHLGKIWNDAIEDHYDVDMKTTRYWCLKVDAAK
jgi:hypothetical protein